MCSSGVTIISGMLYLIWKYHSKKPLGMETLFDFLIKDLILTLAMSLITFQISTLKAKYFCPKDNNQCIHSLALAVLHLAHFNFAAILMQILVCNFVRYLSIFRQTVLTEISDKKIVKMRRLVMLLSAFLSNLLDNICRIWEKASCWKSKGCFTCACFSHSSCTNSFHQKKWKVEKVLCRILYKINVLSNVLRCILF